jgi:hypothetical protein
MEIAHTTAGIKQVTDFGSHDFDVYVICVSTHKPDDIFSPQIDGLLSVADIISRSKERWCAGINRKHYTKRNIKESI